jgi:undecaprenyl phosphate N,N'-diacetylbacillosamine 1-phosphate transferase
MGKPIFFRQERPGLNEITFKLLKFRTMNFAKNGNDQLLPPIERITKLGKTLRKTSLDELPELINIIKGEMSFVGPRPLLTRYLSYYSLEERKRHSVKPGLTGLAQIKGRNTISWDDRFKYDLWYVDHISFGLDIRIIICTFIKVLKSEGINSSTTEIVKPFDEYLKAKKF